MDPWRNSVEDLQALGVQIDQDQRDVLEEGGEVLVIRYLPVPGSDFPVPTERKYGDMRISHSSRPTRDNNGEIVMAALIMNSTPLDQTCPAELLRRPGVITMADWLFTRYMEPRWRYWPSYTGYMNDDHMPAALAYLMEQHHVVRVWGGIPVKTIGYDTAVRIVRASEARIAASHWEIIDDYLNQEEDNYAVPIDPERNPDWNYGAYDLEFLKTQEKLKDIGLWNEEDDNGAFYRGPDLHLKFLPMSSFLAVPDLTIWENLISRSKSGTEAALTSIPIDHYGEYVVEEKEFEPWF